MSLPVEEVKVEPERLSARVTTPLTTAPLSARPSRSTSALAFKPPSMGKYTYWDCRASGFRLEYKKRNASQVSKKPVGFDYLYFGYWSRADMLALMTELSPDELMRVLHYEANRIAKRFLERQKVREKNGNIT